MRVFTLSRIRPASLVLFADFCMAVYANAPNAPLLSRLHVSAESLHSSHAFH
jgi:hypothetical protein